jgi:predicted RND superfamily exporter protein
LAVGVDFVIHIINRYREEAVKGFDATEAMRTANNQLMVAFVIVTVTTVFGFGANIISDLPPIRNLGIVSSVGIIFTFLIFGLFLPAAKLAVDDLRERYGVPEFDSSPIASEESALGYILAAPAAASRNAPTAFVVVILLSGVGMGAYGAGVDTTFDTDDFLPPEEQPGYVEYIPEPFAPGEYTVTETINLLEDRFDASQDETVTVFVEGPFEEGHALEALDAPNDNPPDSLAVGPGGTAEATSILTEIQTQAESNPEFAALVERNDRNGNGIPDQNLGLIYDELATIEGNSADQYLSEDRRSAQVSYTIDAETSQTEVAEDTRDFAEDFRYTSTATGGIIIFDAVSDLIFESAIQGLVFALVLTGVFLMLAYAALEGQPLLGIVNLFPIAIAVAFLLGTMRFLGMALNALTATILSISIGIGIAYSVHTTHRFLDEFKQNPDTFEAIRTTLIGTGGALTGSMLTTSLGTGALALAITPVLGDFGLLMAISVFYSFVASIIALPPAIFVYARVAESPHIGRIQMLFRRIVSG